MFSFPRLLVGIVDWLFRFESSGVRDHAFHAWGYIRPQEYRQVRQKCGILLSPDLFTCMWIYSQVHPDDDNVLSVVDYAVGHLKVKHGRFTRTSAQMQNRANKTILF